MGKYTRTMAESLRMVSEVNNMDLMRKAADGAMQTMKMRDGKVKMDSFTASAIMQIYDKVNPKNKKTMENMLSTGKIADIMKLQKFAMSKTSGGTFRGNQGIKAEYVPEEIDYDALAVELVEAPKYDLYHKDFSSAMQHAYKMAKKLHGITVDPKEIDDKVASGPKKPSSGKTNSYRLEGDKGSIQVQVYNMDNKKYELNMYKEEVELDEKVDPADIDMDATDDDIKSADKNIMMQMRKVQSLKGNYAVEFMNGKKQKIDPKIAMAVQAKYLKMRRPAEKEMFQSKISKSYKDMLSALKEGFSSDAQRKAAFASGYKEKGKKKKEEVEIDEGTMNDVIVMRKGRVSVSVIANAANVKKKEKEGFKIDGVIEKGSSLLHKEPKRIMKAIKGGDKLNIGEGTKQVLAHGGKGKYKVTKDGDKIEIKFGGKVVGTADFDRGADSFFVSMKGEKGQKSFDDPQAIADYFAKNKITEDKSVLQRISQKIQERTNG